ncbi:MAG: glutamate--tRNA ligase [Nitrososphaerota archaeon]|nr:glutamate--tRNA ligase [Candidatus Bathyarchaeota archaeon]MDW8194320.1 glutamate--tRNA ligase [Nitrososphaerota archaeon]
METAGLEELIRKTALLNAVRHEGKAQAGAVLGKVLAERQDLKSRAKELILLVNKIVGEVNALPASEQKRIIEEKWPELLQREKTEEEKRLPPLPNAEKYPMVVTRFSPNPDCVLHLGSARAIILSHDYARIHRGKFILRFEDTDPKLKRPVPEFYDSIREDLKWLECKPDEEYIQSDRIPIYYEYAEKLLKDGNAYVCTCQPQAFRMRILAQEPCPCRNLPPEEQLERWSRMLNGEYKEGEAVLRVKTDLTHPNPAVRDWPALRIIDTEKFPHPRTGSKYMVWPLYNFACGLDDHLMGVTHIIRGKEHFTNMIRQEYMYRHLGWRYPEAIHYGRLKIKGAYLSKSKIVQGIREGQYWSWDDPRLATFAALRKRGITPAAIRKLILDVGLKAADVVLSWENLYAYNRKILDPHVTRYFFVKDPVQLSVSGIPKPITARIRLHPEHPEWGFREYTVTPEEGKVLLWISRADMEAISAGKTVRLMELFNVKVEKVEVYAVEAKFLSESYQEARELGAPLIHWVIVGADMPCKIIMPNAAVAEGIAEAACKRLKPDMIVQFERFGFVRIEKVNAGLTAYYAHK